MFAQEGAKLVITDVDEGIFFSKVFGNNFLVKAKAVAEKINSSGGQAIAVPGDVTDEKFPEKVTEKI